MLLEMLRARPAQLLPELPEEVEADGAEAVDEDSDLVEDSDLDEDSDFAGLSDFDAAFVSDADELESAEDELEDEPALEA
jgi:hypothetical protein